MAATQQVEFPIQINLGAGLRTFFHSQLFVTPPEPVVSFAGKTVIVTGANSGLGLEASRHFYRLGAAKVIVAVRTVSKGQQAKEDILESVKLRNDAGAVDVWQLDMASTQSVLAFADRVKGELSRVDAVVLNAGVNNTTFQAVEGYEAAVQINVLNTFLLALLLLPKLNVTKAAFMDTEPHMTVVSSEAHRLTKFSEINAPNVYYKMNEESAFEQQPRYQATKLIEVLLVRELVARLRKTASNDVIINAVNPGLCASKLGFGDSKPPLILRALRQVLHRKLEIGARCYVLAAAAPATSNGEFISDGKNQDAEAWIYTDLGQKVQTKV